MSHTCHAHGCTAEAPPKMFMCRAHWARLRKVTQNAIWREYTPGQEHRKDPTVRYLAVQQYAIGEVAFRPNDEDAAKVAAEYILKAMQWRQMAIDAGDGDPLEGVAKAKAKPAPIVAGRGKVLSVWAPWAQLFFIDEDPKDVENRPWVTTYRGPVYIHCSKGGHSRAEVALILERLVSDGMITGAQATAVEDRVELDRGHVIGVVQLVGAKRFSQSRWWVKGEVALEVAGAKLIDRIPHRGEQGLRDFVIPHTHQN